MEEEALDSGFEANIFVETAKNKWLEINEEISIEDDDDQKFRFREYKPSRESAHRLKIEIFLI